MRSDFLTSRCSGWREFVRRERYLTAEKIKSLNNGMPSSGISSGRTLETNSVKKIMFIITATKHKFSKSHIAFHL